MIHAGLRRTAPRWLLGAVFLLSGCAVFAPSVPEPPSERITQLWQQHAQLVRAQTDWALSARISATSEDDGWSGKLHWQQGKETFQVSFNAPFGQGGLQLDGNPQQVEMRTSDGQTRIATSAESLLQQFGWQLPLSNLRYWVRGVPVPNSEADPVLFFDEVGRLARLRQSQWDIEYRAYRLANGLMLPRKIYLENGDLNVRLVIDRWAPDNSDS